MKEAGDSGLGRRGRGRNTMLGACGASGGRASGCEQRWLALLSMGTMVKSRERGRGAPIYTTAASATARRRGRRQPRAAATAAAAPAAAVATDAATAAAATAAAATTASAGAAHYHHHRRGEITDAQQDAPAPPRGAPTCPSA